MRRILPFPFAFLLILLFTSQASASSHCQFVLGFKTLRDLIGHATVGECLENQRYAANGNAEQRTTGGLMAWRKADNWTAFTDGYRTWINGPNGLVQRLNTERFPWEADTVAAPTPTATPIPVAAWPGVSTVPMRVPHRFTYDGETWEVTVLEVVRGQELARRVARGYQSHSMTNLYDPPPSNQEDIAVKVRIKLVSIATLGRDSALFQYTTCGDRWCIRVYHLGALQLLMEQGGTGALEYHAGFGLGGALDIGPFLYVGEDTIGWRSWRIWKGEKVVLAVKLDDDQTDMLQYPAVFSTH